MYILCSFYNNENLDELNKCLKNYYSSLTLYERCESLKLIDDFSIFYQGLDKLVKDKLIRTNIGKTFPIKYYLSKKGLIYLKDQIIFHKNNGIDFSINNQ